MPETKKIGELLLESGYITKEQLEKALEEQKKTGTKLGQILVEHGVVSPIVLGKLLGNQLDIPYIKLSEEKIEDAAIKALPERFIRENLMFPFKIEGNYLNIALVPPLSFTKLEEASLTSGYKLRIFISTEVEILQLINKIFSLSSRTKDLSKSLKEIPEISRRGTTIPIIQEVGDPQEAPVIRLANSIVSDAINSLASDVHLESENDGLKVRYRIDGILYDITKIPLSIAESVISRIKITAGMDIAEKRRSQDGHFSVNFQNKIFDFRIASLGTTFGEKLTIRILNKKTLLFPLERLGMLEEQQNLYEEIIKKPYGIILVTGPTGSGKTTTLYATLNKLNERTKSIVTIEDPVEYDLDGTTQIQVNPVAGITFENGLRSILRLDPNIIMVGEIRDKETASIAVEASLTGHLVLASLHTNNSSSAPVRLIDMGVEPYLITSSLISVVAQRLVRLICPVCKENYIPDEEELKTLTKGLSMISLPKTLKRGVGCPSCNGSGYSGRIGVFEILKMSPDIKNLVLEKAPSEKIEEQAKKDGMISLKEAGLKKVIEGMTTLDEVKRVILSEE